MPKDHQGCLGWCGHLQDHLPLSPTAPRKPEPGLCCFLIHFPLLWFPGKQGQSQDEEEPQIPLGRDLEPFLGSWTVSEQPCDKSFAIGQILMRVLRQLKSSVGSKKPGRKGLTGGYRVPGPATPQYRQVFLKPPYRAFGQKHSPHTGKQMGFVGNGTAGKFRMIRSRSRGP